MLTKKPYIHKLPYNQNTIDIFAKIAEQKWAVWLDSCHQKEQKVDNNQNNRFDIISCLPQNTYLGFDDYILKNNNKINIIEHKKFLKKTIKFYPQKNNENEFIFTGGYIGFFSYDFGNYLHDIKRFNNKNPLYVFAEYDWAFINDHKLKKSYLISRFKYIETKKNWQKIINIFENKNKNKSIKDTKTHIKTNINLKQYKNNFNKIQNYIQNGDAYQINYAIDFKCPIKTKSFDVYQQIRQKNNAPYSAFFNLPYGDILSFSPEMFIKVNNNNVITQPIKGTISRLNDKIKDKKQQTTLLNSEKDKAENLMIVDLLRNDLGKSSQIGSVKVKELFKLESFASIHHLISTITAKIDKNKNSLDVFLDCIPGGSITGAPKKRAMQIIAELEGKSRLAYCGNITCFDYGGDLLSNITIRTATLQNNELKFFAGGGITAYSTAKQEYQECFDKIKPFFDSLQQD
ncbi:MAG: aminodeoxychorismate synthase component I [Gammaproteobacteria bacterium]|nr:MAG: aminodeoxychorismate synthase component I [Gammaproteobacteria bacterium]